MKTRKSTENSSSQTPLPHQSGSASSSTVRVATEALSSSPHSVQTTVLNQKIAPKNGKPVKEQAALQARDQILEDRTLYGKRRPLDLWSFKERQQLRSDTMARLEVMAFYLNSLEERGEELFQAARLSDLISQRNKTLRIMQQSLSRLKAVRTLRDPTQVVHHQAALDRLGLDSIEELRVVSEGGLSSEELKKRIEVLEHNLETVTADLETLRSQKAALKRNEPQDALWLQAMEVASRLATPDDRYQLLSSPQTEGQKLLRSYTLYICEKKGAGQIEVIGASSKEVFVPGWERTGDQILYAPEGRSQVVLRVYEVKGQEELPPPENAYGEVNKDWKRKGLVIGEVSALRMIQTPELRPQESEEQRIAREEAQMGEIWMRREDEVSSVSSIEEALSEISSSSLSELAFSDSSLLLGEQEALPGEDVAEWFLKRLDVSFVPPPSPEVAVVLPEAVAEVMAYFQQASLSGVTAILQGLEGWLLEAPFTESGHIKLIGDQPQDEFLQEAVIQRMSFMQTPLMKGYLRRFDLSDSRFPPDSIPTHNILFLQKLEPGVAEGSIVLMAIKDISQKVTSEQTGREEHQLIGVIGASQVVHFSLRRDESGTWTQDIDKIPLEVVSLETH